MNNIKNKIKSINTLMLTLMLTLTSAVKSYALGAGDPLELANAVDTLTPKIEDFIKPISAVLVFFGIITLGINLILKNRKAEDRANFMWALVTIGIGALILGSCGLIYEFIMGLYVE